MRKICIVTANRADWSRVETIAESVKARAELKLQIVAFGSHMFDKTGLTVNEIKRKSFLINHCIAREAKDNSPASMAAIVGSYITELAETFRRLKPDIVVVPVDRFESLSAGIAASLQNVLVAHVQGGEVTGTIDESIRHALTKLSHLHFVSTKESMQRVIRMGESPKTVFNTGCAGTDLLLRARVLDRKSAITELNNKVLKTAREHLDASKPYFLVIQHPVTTEFGESAKQMTETMEALGHFREQLIILSPNIDAGRDAISQIIKRYYSMQKVFRRILVVKHIPSALFASVLRNTSVLIGNSSSGIREACYFGTPVVNIGSRQNRRERGGNVIDVPYDRNKITKAISRQLKHGCYEAEYIYGRGDSGKKIADILASVKLPPIQKIITY